MHKHRLFSLIATFILIISSVIIEPRAIQAATITFLDVPVTNPAYAPISQLVAAGVISSNPYFFPSRPLSRAELSKMLIGAGRYQSVFTGYTNPTSIYCDVPSNHWAASYIATLTTYQIINGSGTNQCSLSKNFYPELSITRADASKMILKMYSLSFNDDPFSNFSTAIQLGLVEATGNPYQLLTRSEASQIIIRAMTYYSEHYYEIVAARNQVNQTTSNTTYSRRSSSRSSRSSNDFVPPTNSFTQIVLNGNSGSPSTEITTPTPTPTVSASPSSAPSTTPSPSATPTISASPSTSPSPTLSPTPSPSSSPSTSPSPTSSPSPTPSSSPSSTPSATPSPTATPSTTPSPTTSPTPSVDDLTYQIGSVSVQDYWISTTGNDSNPGTQAQPFATFTHAWSLVPLNTTLTSGFRFHVLTGTYSAPDLYIEDRLGSATAPIIFQGEGSVTINGNFNSRNLKYVYFINLSYTSPNDIMHFELGDHILLRNVTLRSPSRGAQEGLKVNQSQYMYVEDSDISGAHDNSVDFVAVQYGHVVRSKIHDSEDWCMYTKGGSASLRIEGNEFFDCGTGGFTAGQGTGFEYMTAPWLQYEAYDIRVVNNIIHNTDGAGLGVNGGYNILMANNTMYQVGARDHTIEIVFGSRSCDGEIANCRAHHNLGGWGPNATDSEVFIGNKHVRILNNIVYNPANPADAIFAIYGPRPTPGGSNAPNPAVTDSDLVIAGNAIWNGNSDTSLGLGDSQGCLDTNPTCNTAQLRANNAINTVEPELNNPSIGNYKLQNRADFSSIAVALPTFSWADVPGSGIPTNTTITNLAYTKYRDGTDVTSRLPGAY